MAPEPNALVTGAFERRFEPAVDNVPEARRQLAAWVRAVGAASVLEQASLALSELATNVVRHARTPFVVHAEWHAPTLRVEVADDMTMPADRAPDRLGFGLVARLTRAWGIDERPDHHGKVVWFEVDGHHGG